MRHILCYICIAILKPPKMKAVFWKDSFISWCKLKSAEIVVLYEYICKKNFN